MLLVRSVDGRIRSPLGCAVTTASERVSSTAPSRTGIPKRLFRLRAPGRLTELSCLIMSLMFMLFTLQNPCHNTPYVPSNNPLWCRGLTQIGREPAGTSTRSNYQNETPTSSRVYSIVTLPQRSHSRFSKKLCQEPCQLRRSKWRQASSMFASV